MEECLICFQQKNKFYVSPCAKHKWCMDFNL